VSPVAAPYPTLGLIVPALIVTMFFNFASLSGRWSLRH
jgi:hypothetical protein